MPLETAYSADVDFCNEKLEPLQQIFPIAKDVFQQWNLYINPSKAEYVHFHLAEPKPAKRRNVVPGAIYRGEEPWRSNKTLGSLMCSVKDITNRCFLGGLAFRKFEKIWLSKTNICLARKIKIYEAQVVSIMLYNCNSWAAPQASLYQLDITH